MNHSTFAENMKIALLGGTGETGVEVILDQNKNKHGDVGEHVSNSIKYFQVMKQALQQGHQVTLGVRSCSRFGELSSSLPADLQ